MKKKRKKRKEMKGKNDSKSLMGLNSLRFTLENGCAMTLRQWDHVRPADNMGSLRGI